MKFWKRLRWAATATFLGLLLASALLTDPPHGGAGDPAAARPVPSIVR